MNEKAYYLSEADLREIKELVRLTKHLRINTMQRPTVPPDLFSAPECYIVLTPIGGIAGRTEETGTGTGTAPDTGDMPGSAMCDIWQIVKGAMVRLPTSPVKVWNPGSAAIAGDAWIVVVRDKPGSWVPSGLGISGGGGGGTTAGTVSFAKCLNEDPVSGLYDARLQVNNVDGTLSDIGASVWLRDANLVTELVNGEIYACTKTGFASGRNVYTLDDFDLSVVDSHQAGFHTGTSGVSSVQYDHVRTITFDSTYHAYDSTKGAFVLTYDSTERVLTVRLNGFTGTKTVCEGDGMLHTWTFESGLLLMAP